ncbi:MAG: ABC transporter substrate-binding protein [Acidimicrobiales bacterium]
MSKMSQRVVGVAFLLAASGVFAACSSGTSNTAAVSGASGSAKSGYLETNPAWSKYTFVVGDNGGDGTEALAADTGIFKDASYKVTFARFTYGPPLVTAAASGDISLGMVGDVPPLTGAATEFGFKIVAVEHSLYPTQPDEDIIVPKGSPIHTLAELKGKSIAVAQGSSANGLVLLALESAGLKPSQVHIAYLAPAAAATAYQAGQVDAWAIWNPQLTLAVQAGSTVLAKGLPPIDQTNNYYVASDKLLDNPVAKAALGNVLERIAFDYAWGNKHLAKYAAALATEDGISVADATAALSAEEYSISPITQTDITAEQTLANAFINAGLITAHVKVASISENVLPAGFNSNQQLG